MKCAPLLGTYGKYKNKQKTVLIKGIETASANNEYKKLNRNMLSTLPVQSVKPSR